MTFIQIPGALILALWFAADFVCFTPFIFGRCNLLNGSMYIVYGMIIVIVAKMTFIQIPGALILALWFAADFVCFTPFFFVAAIC